MGTIHKSDLYEQVRDLVSKAPSGEELPIPPGTHSQSFQNVQAILIRDLRAALRRAARMFGEVRIRPEDYEETSLRQACEALDIPYPSPGAPPELDAARRNMRRKAAECHPDRNGGGHERTSEMQAYLRAYEIVDLYSQAFSRRSSAGSATGKATEEPEAQ